LLKKVTPPIQQVLDKAGMTLADIHSFEVVGGAARIPKVQEVIQEFIGDSLTLSSHLNGDEAMANGASFFAANFSSNFRVRPILLSDGLNVPVNL
jgi:hypoxia up-regulated 1